MVWAVTVTLHIPLYIAANLTTNIAVIYVACFYLGVGLMGRYPAAFVLLTESIPKEHRPIVGTLY